MVEVDDRNEVRAEVEVFTEAVPPQQRRHHSAVHAERGDLHVRLRLAERDRRHAVGELRREHRVVVRQHDDDQVFGGKVDEGRREAGELAVRFDHVSALLLPHEPAVSHVVLIRHEHPAPRPCAENCRRVQRSVPRQEILGGRVQRAAADQNGRVDRPGALDPIGSGWRVSLGTLRNRHLAFGLHGFTQAEGAEDLVLEKCGVAPMRNLLDDKSEQCVIGIAIMITRARCEIEGLVREARDELGQRVRFRGDGLEVLHLEKVLHAGCVTQELVEGDGVSVRIVRDESRDAIGDGKRAALGEEENGRRGESLGDRGNGELRTRRVGDAKLCIRLPVGT